MAHSCPDCYLTCYCGGDVDDCLLDIEADINRCIHCFERADDEHDDGPPDGEDF